MTATWKVEAALRRRHDGEVAVAVQLLASAREEDLATLTAIGLAPPAIAGGLWSGRIAADQLAELAALPSVGYIYDAEGTSSSTVAARRPVPRPAQPAKRGHTKLPPRRP